MSADCGEIRILPEREQRHETDIGNVLHVKLGRLLLSCKCVSVNSSAYLSYEGSICKWWPNFCAQVELLIINYVCNKTATRIITI